MSVSDKKFKTLLGKLNAMSDITMEKVNGAIKKAYPKLEFLDESKKEKAKVLIRPLVFWKVKNMKEDIDNVKTIFELIDDLYPKLYSNTTTIDNYYTSDVRQPVAKRFPSPTGKKGDDSIQYALAKEIVALPDDIKGKNLKDAVDKGTKKLQNQTVVDMYEMLDIIRDNIISTDPMKRAIALLIACGSRSVEFFGKSTYIPYAFEDSKSWVTQNFIAKKRGDSKNTTSAIKPILYFTNEQFIKERDSVLDQLHETYSAKSKGKYERTFIVIEKDKEKLSGKIGESARKASREVFNNREDFTVHTCRALYAIISYDLFGQKKNPFGNNSEFRQWVSDVLGKEGSESATREYAKFVLQHKLNVAEIPAKTEMLEKKVEDLEERLNSLNVNQDEKPLPGVIVKNAAESKSMRLIKSIFEKYISEKGTTPNGSKLEKLVGDRAPRRMVRLFIKS